MKTPPSTEARAKWLQQEAEAFWAVAVNEEDKQRARRLQECAADLMRFHRLKIRFKDHLSPLRKSKPKTEKESTFTVQEFRRRAALD